MAAFESERNDPRRPARPRSRRAVDARVADLGCGPGNSTELLGERFPRPRSVGVDTSDDMLAKARGRLPHVRSRRPTRRGGAARRST